MSSIEVARIDANWRAVVAELDAPRPGRVERALRRCGVPGDVTRLVVATPALRRAWYLSLAIAAVVGLGAAEPGNRGSLFTLLVLAPTVPVLGVALAYGPSADPMYEVQLATPLRGARLLAIRAAAVLVATVVVIGSLAVLTPAARPMAAAWLLPALALTTASLAAMSWLPPRRAAAAVATAWLVGVVLARLITSDPLAVFGVIGQIVALAVALAAGVVTVSRRGAFDRLAGVQ